MEKEEEVNESISQFNKYKDIYEQVIDYIDEDYIYDDYDIM